MEDIINSIDSAIKSVESLLKFLKKNSSIKVRSIDEISVIKATAMSWFNNFRKIINTSIEENNFNNVDEDYKYLINACDKQSNRKSYIDKLKLLKRSLLDLKTNNIIVLSNNKLSTSNSPANFNFLIKDPYMEAILINRWQECIKCVDSSLHLSAIVMMGGLLEGILLAKFNQFTDKSKIFTSVKAPKDKLGKALQLKEWTLRNYIDVAHELNWISQTTKDIGEILRDYRNYIHPHKQYSHGINLNKDDIELLWEITKKIINQLLK